jgi:hypothetical protein
LFDIVKEKEMNISINHGVEKQAGQRVDVKSGG